MAAPLAAPTLLLKPREAAAALSIIERALWSLTARDKVPCVRLGRSVRYEPSTLQAFVAARRESQSNSSVEARHVQ